MDVEWDEAGEQARMRSCGALWAIGSFSPHSKSKVKPWFLSKGSKLLPWREKNWAERERVGVDLVWQDQLVCTKVGAQEMVRAFGVQRSWLLHRCPSVPGFPEWTKRGTSAGTENKGVRTNHPVHLYIWHYGLGWRFQLRSHGREAHYWAPVRLRLSRVHRGGEDIKLSLRNGPHSKPGGKRQRQ